MALDVEFCEPLLTRKRSYVNPSKIPAFYHYSILQLDKALPIVYEDGFEAR